MQSILRYIARAVDVFCMFLVLVLVAVLLVGVFYRYVLHDPLFWSDGLSVNIFTWLLFLGTVISVRRRAMFSIDLLEKRVPDHLKKAHSTLVSCISIFVYLFMGWYGWLLTCEQVKLQLYAFPQYYPFLNFAWVYISIPIAFFLMAVFELNHTVLHLLGKDHEEVA